MEYNSRLCEIDDVYVLWIIGGKSKSTQLNFYVQSFSHIEGKSYNNSHYNHLG